MSAGLIQFEQVWKRFHRGPTHDSLRDLIPAMVRRITSKSAETAMLREGDFWAVRDVSFEVQPGKALGIIGGNGAGKSTILRLLTNIYVPTRGSAHVRGRVGALIEVSAGFHPDLTGRENVFLQGAIMGMPQSLIRQRFDEIVEFSGIPQFIDTPVKRYSSGMNARLGFSIAAHLEPEVLIIDEVLSVGDAEFQSRAFERIRSLVRADIPVVIVSHQLDRVVELCSDAILLRQGQIAARGEPRKVVQEYLHGTASQALAAEESAHTGIGFTDLSALEPASVASGSTFVATATGVVTADEPPKNIELAIMISEVATNTPVYWNRIRDLNAHPNRQGEFAVTFEIQANLAPGLYRMDMLVWDHATQFPVGQGPHRIFQVTPNSPFMGTHQLNVSAQLQHS